MDYIFFSLNSDDNYVVGRMYEGDKFTTGAGSSPNKVPPKSSYSS